MCIFLFQCVVLWYMGQLHHLWDWSIVSYQWHIHLHTWSVMKKTAMHMAHSHMKTVQVEHMNMTCNLCFKCMDDIWIAQVSVCPLYIAHIDPQFTNDFHALHLLQFYSTLNYHYRFIIYQDSTADTPCIKYFIDHSIWMIANKTALVKQH